MKRSRPMPSSSQERIRGDRLPAHLHGEGSPRRRGGALGAADAGADGAGGADGDGVGLGKGEAVGIGEARRIFEVAAKADGELAVLARVEPDGARDSAGEGEE